MSVRAKVINGTTAPPLVNASHTIAHHPCPRGLGSDTTGCSTIGGLPGLSAAGPGSPPIVLYITMSCQVMLSCRIRCGGSLLWRRPQQRCVSTVPCITSTGSGATIGAEIDLRGYHMTKFLDENDANPSMLRGLLQEHGAVAIRGANMSSPQAPHFITTQTHYL